MKNEVFIIAELSANHSGKIEVALESIKEIKQTGADAVKLQTYTADTITLNNESEDFIVKGGTLWDRRKLYDLYNEAHTPWEWHAELFEAADKEGLVCFSSPFDHSAVDFLETLNTPIYKIASFEITDIPLIEYAASKGKPMIISTGIATEEDIELALAACRRNFNHDITLLKCTSSYPAPIEEANLSMIKDLAERYGVKSGLSDHTLGATAPIVAVALGATVIEKHFILDRALGGVDAEFSMNKDEFKAMVYAIRDAEKAIGIINYELTSNQIKGRDFCRSLYVVEDILAGEVFTSKNVRSIRPGLGLHPKYYSQIIGRISPKDLPAGSRLDETFLF